MYLKSGFIWSLWMEAVALAVGLVVIADTVDASHGGGVD